MDLKHSVSRRFFPLSGLIGLAVVWACHDNPHVDGSAVPTVGSPTSVASCEQICDRLQALCGYAPVDCTTEAGDGFCDTQFTSDERLCIGYGSADDGGYDLTHSCQAAWDCVANAPADAGADGSDDTTDAGSDDAQSAGEASVGGDQ